MAKNPIIKSGGLFSSHYLEVTQLCVRFNDPRTLRLGGVQRIPYTKIDCVLMSPTNELSFQSGTEIFRIPTKPNNPKHQEAIAALLSALERAAGELQRG